MNFYPLWWFSLAKHDPLFASIRNEEQFQKILQNVESKYQEPLKTKSSNSIQLR
jgi:hypothetical protein